MWEKVKEVLGKETAGLPNWVWVGVIVVGLGMGFTIHKFTSKKEAKNNNDNSSNTRNTTPSGTMSDNSVSGDSQEGGFPIEASQTNTNLPYPGLPANFSEIVGQGGLNELPIGVIGSPYLDDYRRRGRIHKKRGRGDRIRDMHRNLEGHGQNPRGGVVAASVGSR